MAKIVMKFGGTSVADLDRIRHVADLVKREFDRGNEAAVVVSAMAGETNKLVGWTRELSPLHDAREYDVVVAAGEQITAGLTAVAPGAIGVSARSWLGWQIPVRTSAMHGSARIEQIEPDLLNERLGQGQVAVIAGFQGVAPDNRISTLGRGGSDTRAVAVAAARPAPVCMPTDSSQRRALTVLLDKSTKPERPEASHAAGPIGLVGCTARGAGVAPGVGCFSAPDEGDRRGPLSSPSRTFRLCRVGTWVRERTRSSPKSSFR